MQNNAAPPVGVPSLNPYVISTARKDDVTSFIVLSKELVACADNPDEKQLRHLHQAVLPRLCLFSALPVVVWPQLVAVSKYAMQDLRKDHKKLLRLLYYHIHVLLGCGRAGTCGAKDADDAVSAVMLPPHVLNEHWQMFTQPTKDVAQIVANLQVLSGIVRGMYATPQKSKQKARQERAVLTNKFVELIAGMLSSDYRPPRGDKKGIFKLTTRVPDEEEAKALIQKTALACIRASLPSKEQKKLMQHVYNVLKSNQALDNISTRHILALAAESCLKSTGSFIQEIQFRFQANMDTYGPTGYLFPFHEGSSSKLEMPNGSSPPLLLSDPFARKSMAIACGAVVKDMGKKAKGTVFWNALVFMACGDPHLMVSFEAMKALLGGTPDSSQDPFSKTKPKISFDVDTEFETFERSSHLIAWQNLMKEEVPSMLLRSAEESETQKKQTVLPFCIERLRSILLTASHSMVSGVCRVACELGRCHAYAFSAKPNLKLWQRSSVMLNPFREDLLHLATAASHYSSSIQHLAFKALIWLQGVDGGPLTPPVITQILSSGSCWPEELMSDILQTLFQRSTVEPSMSLYILDCVNAVVAGNPTKAVPVDLVDFWFYSVEHSDKAHVLNAALQFLSAPLPPRTDLSGGDLGAVSETFSAWRKLKRTVTLWLGNAIAFLAEENPWEERTAVSLTASEGLLTTDLLSAEVTQSPLLMSTISHFVHDLMTGPWESKLAAAKALACIAIQCQEPYRIQIYSVFKGLESSEERDLLGLSSVLSEVTVLLDQIYAGQIMIDECVAKWGGGFSSWPPEMIESVRNRHEQLLEAILKHCQVPTDLFFPLGPRSRALILGEDVPDKDQRHYHRQSSVSFEPLQAQYSDYLRQGSLQVDESFEQERFEEYIDDEEASVRNPTEEEQVELFLRGSQRTKDFMNTPSLREIVAQSSEVAASTPGFNKSYSNVSERDQMQNRAADLYPVEETQQYEAEVTESPYSYEDEASPIHAEPWEASPQGSNGSLTEEERNRKMSAEAENPFNQGMQPYEIGFDAPQQRVQIQEGFPKRAAVLFDFEAEMEGELTVNIGDIIDVLSEIEGGWYFATVQNVMGIKSEGIVPCDYVELQEV